MPPAATAPRTPDLIVHTVRYSWHLHGLLRCINSEERAQGVLLIQQKELYHLISEPLAILDLYSCHYV